MIEVICNDRLGKKVRVKCNEDDTIGDLKKLIAAQTGTRPEKIRYLKHQNQFDFAYLSLFNLKHSFFNGKFSMKCTQLIFIRIQKWYTIYKDHITLGDYEIHDGMGLELYYN